MSDSEIVRTLAEKVCGFRYYTTEGGYEWWDTGTISGHISAKGWNPLTSICDAFAVVEKMREHGGLATMITVIEGQTSVVMSRSHDPNVYQVSAETPGRAICLAAIAALGAKERKADACQKTTETLEARKPQRQRRKHGGEEAIL